MELKLTEITPNRKSCGPTWRIPNIKPILKKSLGKKRQMKVTQLFWKNGILRVGSLAFAVGILSCYTILAYRVNNVLQDGFEYVGCECGNCPSPNVVCDYERAISTTPDRLVYPNTVEEIIDQVKYASENKITIKAIGHAHSLVENFFADGGIILMLTNMTRIITIDTINMIITVEPGVLLYDVVTTLNTLGFALGGLYPAYAGITIGGIISTSAHIGSLQFPASISDTVVSLKAVVPPGKIIEPSTKEELAAFSTHIGVLGVIYEISLKIVPQYKVHTEGAIERDIDWLLNGNYLSEMYEHFTFDFSWYPCSNRVFSSSKDRTSIEHSGNAMNEDWSGMKMKLIPIFNVFAQISLFVPPLSYLLEWVALSQGKSSSVGGAVGYSSEYLTGICVPDNSYCPWNNGLRIFDMEIAVPVNVSLQAIKRVVDFVSQPENLICGCTDGLYWRPMRKSDTTLIGYNYDSDILMFILSSFRPFWGLNRYHEHTYREIERILLEDFGGRPHWGKNTRRTFAKYFRPKASYGENWDKFMAIRSKYDPDGIFMNRWNNEFMFKDN